MVSCYQAPLQTTPNIKTSKYDSITNLILDQAQGNWPYILDSLGINAIFLKNKHGPCPICGGKDRFRFDNKERRGTFYCNHCGAGDGIKLLQLLHRWDFKETIDRVARVLRIRSEEYSFTKPRHINNIISSNPKLIDISKHRKVLNMTWQYGIPVIAGDPVDSYLKARGIELDQFPTTLRYHSNLPYYDEKNLIGHFPAMLALVTNQQNKGVTLHRTYLGNSCKADVSEPKKLMSPIIAGATQGSAIKLYQPKDGKLALAEGIETALAFGIATQTPVWATISAGGLEKVVLPSDVREVIIAVDNDKSGRGQEAASKLAKRLLSEGRTVKRVMPPKVGQDFNDVLLEATV